MIRRGAGGLLLATWLAACGSTPPSTPLPTGTGQAPRPTLKETGKPGEPLPPGNFDPTSVPVLYYFTGDGRVGVWSGPVGQPDLAVPLVDPIPDADGSYGTAARFPDGSVVVPFLSGDDSKVLLLRPGADPRELLDRAGGAVGASPEAGSFVVARTAGLDDDGIWQAWLDGRDPVQVLPPVGLPELADRNGLALSADGKSVAAAACSGEMQIRWAGRDPARIGLGIPIGFDPDGGLIAFGDCGRFRIFRVTGEPAKDDLGPLDSAYQAQLTPDRRHLLFRAEASPGLVGVIDLVTSQRGAYVLPGAGWDFTPDTTNRYVVLRRYDGEGALYRFTWAVHDLVEGWTGYFVVDTFPSLP